MKKILAIGLVLVLALSLLTACGDNSDGGSTPAGSGKPPATQSGETVGRLNPPAWLIGEWVTTEGANPQGENIKVTENNVVVSSGNLDFSWQINNTGLVITEISEENRYRLEYVIDEILFSYQFTLKDDGSLNLRLFDAGKGITYTKK